MALKHFADPHHPLQETQYNDKAGHCSICLLKLAGHRGLGCFDCNIHLHAACARHFKETISSFAHPSHTLKLRHIPGPDGRRSCDICTGLCPPGSFVYSCIKCGFDAHSLCAMLPERAPNPSRTGHELIMVSSNSPGCCSTCHRPFTPLPMWRYTCSSLELHIACVIDPPTAAGGQSSNGQRSFGDPAATYFYPVPVTTQGYYNNAIQGYGHVPVVYGPPIHGNHGGSSGQTNLQDPGNLMTAIAKFLAKATLSAAVSAFANELLSGAFNN